MDAARGWDQSCACALAGCLLLLACSPGALAGGVVSHVVITDSGLAWVEATPSAANPCLMYDACPGNLVRWERQTNRVRRAGSCDRLINGLAAKGDVVYMSCSSSGPRVRGKVLASRSFGEDAVEILTMDPLWIPDADLGPAPAMDHGPAVCGASNSFLVIANDNKGMWRVPLDGGEVVQFPIVDYGGYLCSAVAMNEDIVLLISGSIFRVDPTQSTYVLEYAADNPDFHWVDHGRVFWPGAGGIWMHILGQATAAKIPVEFPAGDQYTEAVLGGIAADSTYVYAATYFASTSDTHDATRGGSVILRAPISGGATETLVDDPDHFFWWLGVDRVNLYFKGQWGLGYHPK